MAISMQITDDKIDAFCQWLERRGRSDGTIALYRYNLRSCSRHPKGLMARLLDRSLAPKTRRTNLAALQAWAKFSKNSELRDELEEITLPPAARVKAKIPLEPPAWRALIQHVQACPMDDVVRSVVLIMALRGLRISDVLRIKRKDAQDSLTTGRLVYEGKGGKQIEISVLPIKNPIQVLCDQSKKWHRVSDLLGDLSFKDAGNHVRRAVAKCAGNVGLTDVHPHRLRRTYATQFLKKHAGDPQALPKLVQHMAWSGIAVATGYIDAVDRDELDRTGAEMMADLLNT